MEKFADDAEEEDMRDRAILAGDYPKRTAEEEENDEESDESEDDENDIDLFQDFSDADMDEDDAEDDNPDSMMYSDFFKAPKGSKRAAAKASREKHAKRVKFDPSAEMSDQDKSGDDGDDNEDDAETAGRTTNLFDDMSDDGGDSGEGGEAKSEFEKRQEKLQGLIAKLEDEAVEKKHWTMTGEVESSARPKNSLLQEDVDFDHVQKAVPVITQEATQSLEDIIKRRILNEEWDDVERKKDIQQKPFRPSEQFELNDKAPQKSLAEEYEDAFMAQKAGDAYVPESDAKVTAAHKEIDDLFRNLFVQLDAMSHFHFAPKPLSTEIEIRSSAPALDMEEKLPVNVSTAQQLAPEEVYEKDKGRNGRTGDLVGNSEMTREERKRRRNHKKHFDKAKAKKAAAEAKPKAAAAAAEPSNIKTAEA
ncbi:U3 snoRNP protein [Linderina macrospora]|uniref:U3 snoRNP protein n=1 Tax=Linderina macrospora TaxID=4868 RepID=A0ACC1J368_9FUNG|nr:U3 snoRNP protein [Linderina macrospora]